MNARIIQPSRNSRSYGHSEIQVLNDAWNIGANNHRRGIAVISVKNVKAYNSTVYMLSVACAGLILNACETTGPVAASAPRLNSNQAGIYRAPISGADLERLPNPGMLMTRSSTASVH